MPDAPLPDSLPLLARILLAAPVSLALVSSPVSLAAFLQERWLAVHPTLALVGHEGDQANPQTNVLSAWHFVRLVAGLAALGPPQLLKWLQQRQQPRQEKRQQLQLWQQPPEPPSTPPNWVAGVADLSTPLGPVPSARQC